MVEGAGRQPDLRARPVLPARDGRAGGGPARVRRPVQLADLRGRDAARAAVGRVGRQVQPQGGHRPERAGRGGRLRRRGAVAGALAAGPEHAPHRVPARQHRGDARRHPRRHADAPARHDDRASSGRRARSGSPSARPWPASSSMASAGRCRPSSGCRPALSVGTALLVAFGSREVRPEVVPTGRVIDLAFGAVRGVLADPIVRRIFLIFGVSFLATQMTRPYIPVLVEGLAGTGPGPGLGHRARHGHGGARRRRDLAARWRARRPDRVPARPRRRPGRRRRRAARDAVRAQRRRAWPGSRSCRARPPPP